MVCNTARQGVPFFALEGVAGVELVRKDIASIYRATPAQVARQVTAALRKGLHIAAKHDLFFGAHMDLWEHLLSTVGETFDYDLRIARSHPSRRWRCEAVLQISSAAYHYDVLVKDSKSGRTIQRRRIKTTECALPFFMGVGFTQLRWDKRDIVGLSQGKEMFRFQTKLPPQP